MTALVTRIDLILRSAAASLLVAACGQIQTPGDLEIDAGTDPDGIDVTPAAIDVGPVPVGELSASRTLTITNRGDAPLPPLALEVDNPEVVVDSACAARILAAGESCATSVRLSPASPGARAGAINVSAGTTRATVAIAGVGVVPGALTLAPEPFDFGGVRIGEEASVTFTLTNTGEAELPAPALVLGPASAFVLGGDDCDRPLPGGQSCTFDVRFRPTVGGEVSTAVTATSGSEAAATTVRGTGTANLVVVRGGTGAGVVVSAAGIDCGATCSATISTADVTLTATAASGSTFAGWSRAACGAAATCTVAVEQAEESVTASFRRVATLSVVKAGTGNGTVTSTPSGISCGTTCAHGFDAGTAVTLTASATAGNEFAGWSNCPSPSGTTCAIDATNDRTITASFRPRHTLTVQRTLPSGASGSVTSSPAGISCGTDCTESYGEGTSVTLTAAAGANTVFDRWTGACTGTSTTCTIAMSADRTATAVFAPRFTLTLTIAGNQLAGRVRVNPPDQTCTGGTCTFHYVTSTSVTLTATDSTPDCVDFTGWSGACTGSSATCTVQMNTARSATASFARIPGCTPR